MRAVYAKQLSAVGMPLWGHPRDAPESQHLVHVAVCVLSADMGPGQKLAGSMIEDAVSDNDRV
eukprot:9020898-Alexandrium_andersonii.AAC.1